MLLKVHHDCGPFARALVMNVWSLRWCCLFSVVSRGWEGKCSQASLPFQSNDDDYDDVVKSRDMW